jgi:hypothetical protein
MNPNLLKIYNSDNDVFALPQTYKDIKFYPIKVKDIKTKGLFYKLFTIPKHHIPDVNIIKMSYIKFLFFVVDKWLKDENPETDIQQDLLDFLRVVTQSKDIFYAHKVHEENPNPFDKISIMIIIDNVEFNERDFDNIREIVLEQNGSSIEYVNEYNPNLEERLNFLNRNIENTDLKDEIFSFCELTGMTEEQAGEKTIYQFKSRLERSILVLNYKLFKPIEISTPRSSKSNDEKIAHYLSHIGKKGRYSSILVDKDKFLKESGLSDPNSGVNFK